MSTDPIEKLRQAIAAQEALRGISPDEEIETTIAALRARIISMEATLSGQGAVAQGGHAVAATGDHSLAIGRARDVTINQASPDTTKLADFRRVYLDRFAHHCEVLPLVELGGDSDTAETLTLNAVYVDLDTKTRIPLTAAEQKEQRGATDRALTALQAAHREKRLALVGEPGSGKSTFVRQLAGRLARKLLDKSEDLPEWNLPLFPVFTRLRDLAPNLAGLTLDHMSRVEKTNRLAAAVGGQWKVDLTEMQLKDVPDHLPRLLAKENLLLIFDGLDEVAEGLRPLVNEAVLAVQKTYPNVVGVIVTCRVRSYSGAAELPGFARHELSPFNESQIGRFVAAWYTGLIPKLGHSEADKRREDLQRAALGRDLRPLAENPMLLTTMALIHQRDTRLPRERVRLYKQAVEILVRRWQQQKGLELSDALAVVLGDDLKLTALLQFLAYELHRQEAQGQSGGLLRKDIIDWLEKPAFLGDLGLAGEFLDYVDQRAGLLVGRGGVVGEKPAMYDFPHRTFQEYLAGCQLIEGRLGSVKTRYRQRAGEGDFWYLAGQLGAEELYFNRKHPTDLMDLAYALCPVAPPQQTDQWRQVLWSGQLALILGQSAIEADTESPDDGPHYLARLIPRLVSIIRQASLPALERAEAGDTLARLGDPRPDVMTVDGMQFCAVPSGSFMMGSGNEDQEAPDGEQPRHQFDISYDYWLGRYPVTVAQWQEYVEDSGHEPGDKDSLNDPFNRPVRYVTWHEAVAFCQWLTDRWQGSGMLPAGWVVRLPSEAEWEMAARGGLKILDVAKIAMLADLDFGGSETLLDPGDNGQPQRRYPWGNELDANRVNYGHTGIGDTSAVGCFPGGASPYGCEEMSGNVLEWCATKWQKNYQDYQNDNSIDRTDVPRVLRGGAFYDSDRSVRCACRYRLYPDYWNLNVGFRVCVAPLF